MHRPACSLALALEPLPRSGSAAGDGEAFAPRVLAARALRGPAALRAGAFLGRAGGRPLEWPLELALSALAALAASAAALASRAAARRGLERCGRVRGSLERTP